MRGGIYQELKPVKKQSRTVTRTFANFDEAFGMHQSRRTRNCFYNVIYLKDLEIGTTLYGMRGSQTSASPWRREQPTLLVLGTFGTSATYAELATAVPFVI